MSKRNNVNPDHYVGRGRDRNATGIVHDIQKQQFGTSRNPRRGQPGSPNFIPGAAPVGESAGATKHSETEEKDDRKDES
jgi:hypothetical protein